MKNGKQYIIPYLNLKWKIIHKVTMEIKNTKIGNLELIKSSNISKLDEIYENQVPFWKDFKENDLNSINEQRK